MPRMFNEEHRADTIAMPAEPEGVIRSQGVVDAKNVQSGVGGVGAHDLPEFRLSSSGPTTRSAHREG
jgi:hypothetical protein